MLQDNHSVVNRRTSAPAASDFQNAFSHSLAGVDSKAERGGFGGLLKAQLQTQKPVSAKGTGAAEVKPSTESEPPKVSTLPPDGKDSPSIAAEPSPIAESRSPAMAFNPPEVAAPNRSMASFQSPVLIAYGIASGSAQLGQQGAGFQGNQSHSNHSVPPDFFPQFPQGYGLMAGQQQAESTAFQKVIFDMAGQNVLHGHSLSGESTDMMTKDTDLGVHRLSAVTGRSAPMQSANVPNFVITVPVSQSVDWSESVSQRILWQAQNGLHQARLHLHPQHLGPMEVRISINAEQQVSVNFSAMNSAVRDALEAAIPRLREMFGEQELELVDVNVSDKSMERQQQTLGSDEFVQGADMQNDDEGNQDEMDGKLARVSLNALLDVYA